MKKRNIAYNAMSQCGSHRVQAVFALEGAETSESNLRHEGREVRKKQIAGLALVLCLVLLAIVFVSNASLIMQTGPGIVTLILGLLLIVAVAASVMLFSGDPDEKSEKGVPRAAIRLFLVGLTFVGLAFVFFFATITILPYEMRTTELFFLFLSLLVVGLGIASAGRLVAEITYSHRRFRVPPNLMKSLQQIEPDASFETERFHVFRKGVIYIFLRKRLWGVHFIRLFESHAVSGAKVKVPYTGPWPVWIRSLKYEVNSLRSARVRREFTIPASVVKVGSRREVKFIRGAGILYYVSLYPMGRYTVNVSGKNLSEKLDKPTIIKILHDLSEEKAVEALT
jgi:hypothetical protein